MCLSAMTSCTVLMPTASAPRVLSMAISAGVSDTESVDLSPINQQAAVIQVVGWHGAQNPYNIQINCG